MYLIENQRFDSRCVASIDRITSIFVPSDLQKEEIRKTVYLCVLCICTFYIYFIDVYTYIYIYIKFNGED